jgi:RES domain-containing protein
VLAGHLLHAALAKIQPVHRSGYATRFVAERHRRTALAAVGAVTRGGRFNPPGIAALYTSLQRVTALSEVTDLVSDDDPLVPYLMLTAEYEIDRVLDLTDVDVLNCLELTAAELVERIPRFALGTAPTQFLGEAAVAARFQAIIAPSRPQRDGTNLVIFTDLVRTGDVVVYDDPPNRFENLELMPRAGNVIPLRTEPANG